MNIRSAINRHIKDIGRNVDIVRDVRFNKCNRTLDGFLKTKVAAYNAENKGSSTRIGRVLLMTEPPNIDAGEITDKGYLNQRSILSRRDALVEQLYDISIGDDVVVMD